LGKIFKALEKSQQTIENSAKIEEKLEPEPIPLSDFRDQENNHINEIKIRPVRIDPMLVTGLSPQSMESEQFRLLKNNILFPEKGTVPKCIMITSTTPGEGKSFVAANLAISLSQSIDEYVLLMDCDLRSPTIHSMFGYNDTYGLSEYLSKAKPLSSLLVNSFLDKLTILPAGQIPSNPSELLSSEQMRRLIHEVKLRYSDRYIIIDTPPPSLTSETSVISRQVDGIVIVIKQGQTRKKDILNVIDIYGREKILGVVYNFANKPIGYGYSKYGYGKYGCGVKNT
jgi:exopolysaccharide/PEP-CTERM locus tyrosine autokinase